MHKVKVVSIMTGNRPGVLAKVCAELARRRNNLHALYAPEGDGDATLKILTQVGIAIFYIHAHSTVHLDLKPANILVNTAGVVKLTDFYLKGLRDGGLRVREPSQALSDEFKAFGQTMTTEWLKSVGADGKAILQRFHRQSSGS